MCFEFLRIFLWIVAAPLLCAGITLYSPLMHWKAGPGKKAGIIGLGGLGHIGVKIAHTLGAEVTVLSHSLEKQEEAKRMGADYFYDTSNREALKKLRGYFDMIINTVSVEFDSNKYMKLLDVDGTMIVVGLPEKEIRDRPLLTYKWSSQSCRLCYWRYPRNPRDA